MDKTTLYKRREINPDFIRPILLVLQKYKYLPGYHKSSFQFSQQMQHMGYGKRWVS